MANMFDKLTGFMRGLPGAESASDTRDLDDPRIAAAALMFHVMDADGVRHSIERDRLERLLNDAFSISGGELQRLIKAGEAADKDAVDLYSFTSVLKRNLDSDARSEFIRILWEIVYADGERHELEDNIVWRVAELIGVERAERVALRRSVAAAAGLGEGR